MAGAFELTIPPRQFGGRSTVPPLDLEALEAWGLALARDAGLEPRAGAATDPLLRTVAIARQPSPLAAFARGAPTLEVRPLHRVTEYFAALLRVAATARDRDLG